MSDKLNEQETPLTDLLKTDPADLDGYVEFAVDAEDFAALERHAEALAEACHYAEQWCDEGSNAIRMLKEAQESYAAFKREKGV